jgi:hypothetical protein
MKPIYRHLCLLIIAITVVFAAGCQSAIDNVVELKLQKDVEATNKQGGMEIAEGVRMDSASTTGKTIRFNYTMLEVSKEDINAATFYKATKEELIKIIGTNKEMEFYKKNNVTMAYAYYYQDGTPLSTIIIKPEDYTHKK